MGKTAKIDYLKLGNMLSPLVDRREKPPPRPTPEGSDSPVIRFQRALNKYLESHPGNPGRAYISAQFWDELRADPAAGELIRDARPGEKEAAGILCGVALFLDYEARDLAIRFEGECLRL
ncbi:MAG: hypothetical protein AB1405_02045 [Bdellovibrionota bacterium]